MRQVTLIAAILVLVCAGSTALAQQYPGKGNPGKGMPLPPDKQGNLERMERVERMGEAPGPARPVHDRMSPEERRQLRHDIDQHGRELYRGKNR